VGRPHRIVLPGGVYHVTARGTGPIEIYRDDADRRCFLKRLAAVEQRFAWIRRALCLMGTHYHLLVETPQPNLSAGMHQLNGLYATLFNQRHGRVGALFQGRFHAVLVENRAATGGHTRLRRRQSGSRRSLCSSGGLAVELVLSPRRRAR